MPEDLRSAEFSVYVGAQNHNFSSSVPEGEQQDTRNFPENFLPSIDVFP